MRALRVPELPGDLDLAFCQPGFSSAPSAGIQPDAHLFDRDCGAFAILAAEDLSQRAAVSQSARRVVMVLVPLIAAEASHRRIGHRVILGDLTREQLKPLHDGPQPVPETLDL